MLVPRFSVRWLLAATAVCAVLAFVASLAVAEYVWAMALLAVVASLVLSLVLYAAFFFAARACGLTIRRLQSQATAKSPFAMHTPPPQLLQPEDPD